ncbi:MAG: GNAT family N-acetyltransferase [Alphaproteobacteria bacterium]|nr:MAG: GNAT family N-acetyltransferase [Alphaproteobacteria bacterium]
MNIRQKMPHADEAVSAITVRCVCCDEDRESAYNIRRDVLVHGGGLSARRELDRLDDEDCWHYLAFWGRKPVGTARARHMANGEIEIERVVVLPEYRGHGVGTALMAFITKDLTDHAARLLVRSRLPCVSFFESHGFHAIGPEYRDDMGAFVRDLAYQAFESVPGSPPGHIHTVSAGQ